MFELRGQLYRVTENMTSVFRNPFWGRPGYIPEDKKEFASALNLAIQTFQMSVNKDLETADLLFKVYVEAEKLLNR